MNEKKCKKCVDCGTNVAAMFYETVVVCYLCQKERKAEERAHELAWQAEYDQ